MTLFDISGGSAKHGRALIAALLFVLGASAIFEPGGAVAALYMPQEPTPAVLDDRALSARYQQTITAEGLAARLYFKAKEDGHGPRRSLLFVNFSGEEKGLLGSTFYTEMQPLVPLERIVADINMDGVAGFDLKHPAGGKDYIYVVGSERDSAELLESNRRLNELTGLKLRLDYPPNFNSDQISFQQQYIPFIYFSTGLTEHYHRPSDEPQTIEYNHLARVVRLVFANAWQAANRDAPPRGFARGRLTSAGGYSCPAGGAGCDDLTFEQAGECPVCGMVLLPRVESKGGR